MAIITLAGQRVDLEDLPPAIQEQVRAAQAEVGDSETEESSARRDLSRAKTEDQIRLAELRLEAARQRRIAAQERFEAQARAAELAEQRRVAEEQRRSARQADADAKKAVDAARRKSDADAKAATARREATRKAATHRQGREAIPAGRFGTATATSVLPESKDVRFLDAGIVAGVAAGTVLYTATRPTALGQYGAGLLWMALGGLMLVEGRGALLRYGGAGLVGANAAYLALRTFEPNLTAPLHQQPSTQYVRVGSVMVPVSPPAA